MLNWQQTRKKSGGDAYCENGGKTLWAAEKQKSCRASAVLDILN